MKYASSSVLCLVFLGKSGLSWAGISAKSGEDGRDDNLHISVEEDKYAHSKKAILPSSDVTTYDLPSQNSHLAKTLASTGLRGPQVGFFPEGGVLTEDVEGVMRKGHGFKDNVEEGQAASWQRFNRLGKTITRTSTFSEENGGYSGRQTAPIAGISCSGKYCDNKRLVVVRDGTSAPLQNSGHWTSWFSEEGTNYRNCPSNMIVNELQCSGKYCDNIRLQCGTLKSDYRVDTSDRSYVGPFSEEQGERLCSDGYYLWGMQCSGRYCDNIKLTCVRVDYLTGPAEKRDHVVEAEKYKPIYYFDGSGPSHCLPDWPSSGNDNTCRTSFLANTPSFVQYNICGSDEVYTYWLWYGDQKGCIVVFDQGHGNDWEHVSVFVRDGEVKKVIYFQHKGRYTRRRGTFSMSGERPHVYVGKIGHGSYHAGCDGVCSATEFFTQGCLGSVNYCQGGCGYWDDFRNPGPSLSAYKLYDLQKGVTVDGIERPDRDICVSSCEGSGDRVLGTSGCWQNKP